LTPFLHPFAMDSGYVVTKRGPDGRPREIGCRQHPGCTWTMAAPAAQRDDDPVFQAMFMRHLERRSDPGRPAGGHSRQRRR
jgi:hypothetical protein